MLKLLEPEKVVIFWDDIKSTLIYNLPPLAKDDGKALNNILESIIGYKTQVWVLLGEGKLYAVCITTTLEDPSTKTKNLLIYSLYGYSFVPEELWREGLSSLKAFAQGNGYSQIVAYTKVPTIVSLAKKLGGSTDTTFITLEVDNGR